MAVAALPSHSPGRQFITNAGALAIGGIAAQVAFLFVEAVIARKVGVQAYGTFSALYTSTLLIVLAIDLGMNWKLIEEGAREPQTIPVNLGSMLCLKVLLVLVLCPLVLAALVAAGSSSGSVALFAAFAGFGLLMLVQESLASVYAAVRRNWINALFQAAVPVIIALAVIVLVVPEPSLNRTAYAYVLGSAVPTVVWVWLSIRHFAPRVEAARFGPIVRGSYLYGINALLSYSSFKSGILLLMVLSSTTQLAYFAAAFKLVDLGYKIPILVNRVVAPQLFADSKHRPDAFPALCEGLLRGAATLSALTSLVLLLLGGELIRLIFGADYAEAAILLQILGVSLALKTFSLIAGSVVTSAGQLSFRTRALATAITVGVLVSVPLIIRWGARGAAAGVLVADVSLLLALLWSLRTTLPSLRVVTTVVAPTLAVAAIVGLCSRFEAPAVYSTGIGIVLILGVLYFSGYLRPVMRLAESPSARPR